MFLPLLPFSAVPLTVLAYIFSNFPYNLIVQSPSFFPLECWKICVYRLSHPKPEETFALQICRTNLNKLKGYLKRNYDLT